MGSRRQTIFCEEPLISGTIGNKVLGTLSHPSETPRLWPLKAGVGGEPRAALTAVGRSPLSGVLLHTIESSSKCVHFWKHVGPEAESWRHPSLPVTQRSEGSKAFWHVRLKKIIQPEMQRKRKAKRSHPYKASKMKKMLLRNQQQASGCGNRRPALHLREGAAGDGQVLGQWARRVLPEVSEQCSRSTPFSTLVIFILHSLWRPDESSVTHWKYPEHSISSYLTLGSSERFSLKTRLCKIIYSNNHSFNGLNCYPFVPCTIYQY